MSRSTDARFAGRQRGTLDMHIVGDLEPARLRGDGGRAHRATASSRTSKPTRRSSPAPNPIRIALAPRAARARDVVRARARADACGRRRGCRINRSKAQLDGEGELAFGAGYLSGDGHIEIVDGRFEDKLTGVTLVDLDARVAIDDRGVTIENFTAAGPRGGRLTATGGSANSAKAASPSTSTTCASPIAPTRAPRASGELTLAWEGLRSSLTGELNIIEANIDIASNPEAGIPTLDVIEINRPGE